MGLAHGCCQTWFAVPTTDSGLNFQPLLSGVIGKAVRLSVIVGESRITTHRERDVRAGCVIALPPDLAT